MAKSKRFAKIKQANQESLLTSRILRRLGKWIYSIGERLEKPNKPDMNKNDQQINSHSDKEHQDHVEGIPEDTPSFPIAGLSDRVTGKSMASLRAEAIQLMFALHAGHVIAAEILLSRKIDHLIGNNRSIKPRSTEELRQLNQFITNWTTDAGMLDAAISLLRQIELPEATLPEVIEPTTIEAELGRKLLERYEQNFNQQVLEQSLGQED